MNDYVYTHESVRLYIYVCVCVCVCVCVHVCLSIYDVFVQVYNYIQVHKIY